MDFRIDFRSELSELPEPPEDVGSSTLRGPREPSMIVVIVFFCFFFWGGGLKKKKNT